MAKKHGRENSPGSGAAGDGPKETLLDAEARDSPVLSLIARRLRAAKKKAKRADEIEALKATGREINSDQEEALRGKAKNLASIEELEKLLPPLRDAIAEEVGQKVAAKRKDIEDAAATANATKFAEEAKIRAEELAAENSKTAALVDDLTEKVRQATERAEQAEAKLVEQKAAAEARLRDLQAAERTGVEEAVTRVLQLIYFSKLFSKDSQGESAYIHQMERDACLTYNSTVNFEGDSLTAQDLDAICMFGKLVSSRPLTELISHQTALERCKALALDWVHANDTHIPQLNTTVNELVVKFERIVGSGYYSIQPEIKGAHEVAGPAGFRGGEADLPEGFAPAFAAGTQQQPTSNNNALQQLLYQRPNLPSVEPQALGDVQLPNGFIPSISAGFIPSVTGGFVPASFPPTAAQPPGFEPPLPEKRGPPEANGAVPQFFGAGFQTPSYGTITKQEVAPHASANGNGLIFMAPETTPAPPAAATEPSPAPAQPAQASESADPVERQSVERKGSSQGTLPARPRAQPVDAPRGRGPGRGRGPPARGDYGARGSGRRGPPGRGYRGRGGRDFQPQPVPQAGVY